MLRVRLWSTVREFVLGVVSMPRSAAVLTRSITLVALSCGVGDATLMQRCMIQQTSFATYPRRTSTHPSAGRFRKVFAKAIFWVAAPSCKPSASQQYCELRCLFRAQCGLPRCKNLDIHFVDVRLKRTAYRRTAYRRVVNRRH